MSRQDAPSRKRKCQSESLSAGDYLSETQHYRVIRVDADGARLRNERGFEYHATNMVIEEGMYTADQFTAEETVSRTRLIEILESAGSCVFTVNFHKKATRNTVSAKLREVADLAAISAKELRELSDQLLLGEERTLIGYLVHTEPKLGRSQVVDLQVADGTHNQRLVDHRTINWLIYQNVKYSVQQ